MDNFIERRAHVRIPFRQQVPLGIEGRENTLTVSGVDLSHGGACINVPMSAPVDRGSLIRVDLPRPAAKEASLTDQAVQYSAEVVRIDRSSRLLEGLAVVGLQFN